MSDRVVNLRDLALGPVEGNPDGHRFRARSLGGRFGAERTGMTVYELEPGQASWPYHFELVEEEWLFVIDGELVLRTPDGERTLRAGDVVCFAAGAAGAHAVRNAGDVVARYAMPCSVAPYGDACVYPDSGKFKISTRDGFDHRGRLGDHVDYWEGET
jgi:uncharacterized cupin superfamily protein